MHAAFMKEGQVVPNDEVAVNDFQVPKHLVVAPRTLCVCVFVCVCALLCDFPSPCHPRVADCCTAPCPSDPQSLHGNREQGQTQAKGWWWTWVQEL